MASDFEIVAPAALFLFFAALAAAGAYLAAAHLRGRGAGLAAGCGTLLFFGALGAGLLVLLSGAGAP